MLAEERKFLAGMKPGLQHRQAMAVRSAMDGDCRALDAIRASRNQAPALPSDVATFRPTPNICLFSPMEPSAQRRPLLMYLHGGGWCFGSINSCARFCATLALHGGCCVAAIDYGLAPSHPFPKPLDDCHAAFSHLRRHADEWGCDPDRIAIGGDSAGGNLALATAMSAKGVWRVVAIYPVVKLWADDSASWRQYAKGYGDDAELLDAFCEAYANGQESNHLASVGLASDGELRALPPVLIISAGHDILLDQTAEFARRLHSLNHSVAYHVYPTATHLFVTVPGQPTAFQQAVATVGEFMNGAE